MSALPIDTHEPEDMPPPEEMENSGGVYQLKKLSGKHKNVLSLVAQGLERKVVAAACGITPDYVTMLCRMPICKQYIAGLNEACDLQLEAMLPKAIKAIDNALDNGNIKEQISGARLHLEVTKRIGRPADIPPLRESTNDRLIRLAERLTALIPRQPDQVTINGSFTEVQSVPAYQKQSRLADAGQAAEADGYGKGPIESGEED